MSIFRFFTIFPGAKIELRSFDILKLLRLKSWSNVIILFNSSNLLLLTNETIWFNVKPKKSFTKLLLYLIGFM